MVAEEQEDRADGAPVDKDREQAPRNTRIDFVALEDEVRARITAYLQERLGLPA